MSRRVRPPKDWREKCLNDIADIRFSNVDKKSNAGEIPIHLCNYMDVYANDYIRRGLDFMEATVNSAELVRFSVERGDVIATKDSETPDDIGVPAVVVDDIENLVCGYHLAQIKPSGDEVDSIFLTKQIGEERIVRYFGRLANGTTRYGLSTSAFEKLPVWLAPLPEQRKIARILTTVDNLIEKTEALIAKYQSIKQGMMHDLFTRGLDSSGQLRPTQEQAPALFEIQGDDFFPKSWKRCKLHKFADVVGGITLGRKLDGKSTIELPYLRVANVQDGYLDLNEMKTVPVLRSEVERYLLKPGDVVMTEGGDFDKLGRGTIWEGQIDPCLHQNHVFRVRPHSGELNPAFLSHLTGSAYGRHYFLMCAKQTTNLASINATQVKAFPLLLPSPLEQMMIVERIAAIDGKIGNEKRQVSKFKLVKSGLMQDLLTGNVRVKVDDAEEVVTNA